MDQNLGDSISVENQTQVGVSDRPELIKNINNWRVNILYQMSQMNGYNSLSNTTTVTSVSG